MRITHNQLVPSPQPPTPSAEVIALRTSWKWAYISHFLFTYNPMLHLEDIQLSELEDDLADGTFEVIPTVMQRLLTSLTPHDKRSILENWQHHLRKQSLKRNSDNNLLGTEEEPIEFSSLIMSDKLHILQCLCEWQFHNPNNLRTRMRDDDDYANWRIEPIAYDTKGNAYWLMGGNRLWIQYAPPKRASKPHKRKQETTSTASSRKSVRGGAAIASSSTTPPTTSKLKTKPAAILSSNGRQTRSARNRQSLAKLSSSQTLRSVGTRVSTRLRGKEEGEVWQSIPEEWLQEGLSDGPTGLQDPHSNGRHEGLEAEGAIMKSLDDMSELTSLSDLSPIEEGKEEEEDEEEEGKDDRAESQVQELTSPASPSPSTRGDMWETVCVTLAEWQAFPERFENSTHRGEKSFYKLLIHDLVPMITEVLRVDVRKKHMEEAVVHRKRSSRIAVKESMREAERAEARRRADEEREMQRHRRWEARARKEEEERLRREASRSARLRERSRGESESLDVDVVGGDSVIEPQRTNGFTLTIHPEITTPVKFVVNNSKAGTQTPKDDEPWELDCEVCHKRGMNLDDGQELMSCEQCNKWQHIRCHDQADFIAGKPRRDWEIVEFLCAACAKGNVVSHSNRRFTQEPTITQYYSASTAQTMGTARPDCGTPVKSLMKQQQIGQIGPGVTSYTNGQTSHLSPRAYPISIASQHSPPHPPVAASSRNAPYPTPIVQPNTSAPYTAAPNMYLSNCPPSYRPLQSTHHVAQHQQQLSPVLNSSVRGQTAVTAAHTGGWPHQQTQYNQSATWNAVAQGSILQGTNTSQSFDPPQSKYYRSHTTIQHKPLSQPQPLASAQSFYSGGPTSKS